MNAKNYASVKAPRELEDCRSLSSLRGVNVNSPRVKQNRLHNINFGADKICKLIISPFPVTSRAPYWCPKPFQWESNLFLAQLRERSALDPIGRSPFLPSWNSHKVELFSAFISRLEDIPSWKCSWKCNSLQCERKNNNYTKDSGIRTNDLDGPVNYANH